MFIPVFTLSLLLELSGHQKLECVSILITSLLVMTKFQTRSYLMVRFIGGQFRGMAHQGRDRDALVAGAAPAVEAGIQGYNSWKYQ